MARKAKTPKFEAFNAAVNGFGRFQTRPGERWQDYLPKGRPLTVELGCGKAEVMAELARRFPDQNFIGVDRKAERLWRPSVNAIRDGLRNIAFIQSDIRQIGEYFEPGSVGELWVTFPDPYPRKKQAKHRLTHPSFLALYAQVLAPEGRLHFKTDNRPLFLWSLEQLVREGWRLTDLSFDLHESDLPEQTRIETHYEKIYRAADVPINYLQAVPPAP